MTTNILGYITRQRVEKLQSQIDTVYDIYYMSDWPSTLLRRLKRVLTKLQKEKERLEKL